MSNARAGKFASGGALLVGAALWLSPPPMLKDWLASAESGAVLQQKIAAMPVEAGSAAVNPLSEMVAAQFSATLERPLFNADRRVRPAAVEPTPVPEVTVENPPPAPETLNPADFMLLAVAGHAGDLVAMVRWNKTNRIYRLKRGQFLAEIELTQVNLREAVLKKDDQSITLALFTGPRAVAPPLDMGAAADEEMPGQGADPGAPNGQNIDIPADEQGGASEENIGTDNGGEPQ